MGSLHMQLSADTPCLVPVAGRACQKSKSMSGRPGTIYGRSFVMEQVGLLCRSCVSPLRGR